jgi:hypothetical protein
MIYVRRPITTPRNGRKMRSITLRVFVYGTLKSGF